jgi:hypothetical protein
MPVGISGVDGLQQRSGSGTLTGGGVAAVQHNFSHLASAIAVMLTSDWDLSA